MVVEGVVLAVACVATARVCLCLVFVLVFVYNGWETGNLPLGPSRSLILVYTVIHTCVPDSLCVRRRLRAFS